MRRNWKREWLSARFPNAVVAVRREGQRLIELDLPLGWADACRTRHLPMRAARLKLLQVGSTPRRPAPVT